jgi:hypothetical protein
MISKRKTRQCMYYSARFVWLFGVVSMVLVGESRAQIPHGPAPFIFEVPPETQPQNPKARPADAAAISRTTVEILQRHTPDPIPTARVRTLNNQEIMFSYNHTIGGWNYYTQTQFPEYGPLRQQAAQPDKWELHTAMGEVYSYAFIAESETTRLVGVQRKAHCPPTQLFQETLDDFRPVYRSSCRDVGGGLHFYYCDITWEPGRFSGNCFCTVGATDVFNSCEGMETGCALVTGNPNIECDVGKCVCAGG